MAEQKRLEDAHAEAVRQVADLQRQLDDERSFSHRLEALSRAALAITALDTQIASHAPGLLQLILDQGRSLTGADYGALGVGTDPDHEFAPWLWSGLLADEVEAIGRHPRPVGLLGQIARDNRVLRLDDIRNAPGAVGLPPHHPEIGPMLGIPIRHQGQSVGNFYLGKKRGAAPFTASDEAIVGLLAEHAAIAIENGRLYDQVRASVRTRDEVLATVSHDLRNPLNAIALREQLLASQHGAAVAEHTASISRVVYQMTRMILGMLDVASLDAGRLRLELSPVNVAELVAEVVESVKPVAEHREITLDVRVNDAGTVELDSDRMWQVLSNLLGNAIKFTPPGGRVEVAARRIDNELAIMVSDTGPGIPPDMVPRIFDRYFTTTPGHDGTGLGLYIVKGLVEAHGGRVAVEPSPTGGARFCISIPSSHNARRVSTSPC